MAKLSLEEILSDLPTEPRVRTLVVLKLCQKQASDWEKEYEKRFDATMEAKLMLNKSVELLERACRAFALVRDRRPDEVREDERLDLKLESYAGQYDPKAYR